MNYDDAVDLVDSLGRKDDWAVPFAYDGKEHTLNEGATLRLCEKWGRTYVSICLADQYSAFRIDAKVQQAVEDYL